MANAVSRRVCFFLLVLCGCGAQPLSETTERSLTPESRLEATEVDRVEAFVGEGLHVAVHRTGWFEVLGPSGHDGSGAVVADHYRGVISSADRRRLFREVVQRLGRPVAREIGADDRRARVTARDGRITERTGAAAEALQELLSGAVVSYLTADYGASPTPGPPTPEGFGLMRLMIRRSGQTAEDSAVMSSSGLVRCVIHRPMEHRPGTLHRDIFVTDVGAARAGSLIESVMGTNPQMGGQEVLSGPRGRAYLVAFGPSGSLGVADANAIARAVELLDTGRWCGI